MPRAYLRLDPGYDEHKESYPDGPYAALIACFCHGEMQPERGRFRNERFLRAILGPRGRHVPYLIAHGDLIRLPDGRLYIDGWDEWQEGDWKVTERVARIRSRKGRTVTPDVTPDVTVAVTPSDTPDVTVPPPARVAGAIARGVIEAVSGKRSISGAGAEQRPPEWDEPEGEALTWLAAHGCDIRPGNGYHQKLILAVENHGINALIGMFDRLEGAGVKKGDIKGYLFGAIDALNGRVKPADLEREDRAGEEAARIARSVARTKAMTAERDRQASS